MKLKRKWKFLEINFQLHLHQLVVLSPPDIGCIARNTIAGRKIQEYTPNKPLMRFVAFFLSNNTHLIQKFPFHPFSVVILYHLWISKSHTHAHRFSLSDSETLLLLNLSSDTVGFKWILDWKNLLIYDFLKYFSLALFLLD